MHLRSAWRWAGAGWTMLVVYLSLSPQPPGADVLPFDAGHFVAYAWLTLWFGQLASRPRDHSLIASALIGLGVALEGAQMLVPPRQFSLADMAVNALGVVAGLALLRTRAALVLDRLGRWLHAQRDARTRPR